MTIMGAKDRAQEDSLVVDPWGEEYAHAILERSTVCESFLLFLWQFVRTVNKTLLKLPGG